MCAVEHNVREAQKRVACGESQPWEYSDVVVLQRLIDDGSVWSTEGDAGRAASRALESGACFLPRASYHDYWGNVVPSRDWLKPGTKGTLENSARFYGLDAK